MYKSIGDGFGKIMASEGLVGFTLVSFTQVEEFKVVLPVIGFSPNPFASTTLFRESHEKLSFFSAVLTRCFRVGSPLSSDMVPRAFASSGSTKFSRMSSRASPEKKTLSSIKLSVSRCPQLVLSSSLTSPSLPGKL